MSKGVSILLSAIAHDLGAAGIYVAMIFGAFSISRAVFLPWFGTLSDKKGRKLFILVGLLGSHGYGQPQPAGIQRIFLALVSATILIYKE